jgi:hypothetical protein
MQKFTVQKCTRLRYVRPSKGVLCGLKFKENDNNNNFNCLGKIFFEKLLLKEPICFGTKTGSNKKAAKYPSSFTTIYYLQQSGLTILFSLSILRWKEHQMTPGNRRQPPIRDL